MRPLAIINGVVLGSCLSISVSLAAVMCVYLLLGDEYPRLQSEFRPLLASALIFSGMTAISAASFYTLLTKRKARTGFQLAMWTALFATAWYYVAQ
ncbi:MAG: hypothetical protein OEW64_02695 [Gammaproteobacteria bacterium]|nr:hypothetical protein [Gammaproteobacteria bacterium]MDH5302987.1 hypothetical protein [Gammaproteobacteria bacterium]MDH5321266.1 hypothetical protein [Gammaproteobacteria bacterium]